jgi:hypothetical protein
MRVKKCDHCGQYKGEYRTYFVHVDSLDLGLPIYTDTVQCKECQKLEKDELLEKDGG